MSASLGADRRMSRRDALKCITTEGAIMCPTSEKFDLLKVELDEVLGLFKYFCVFAAA